MLQNDYYCVIIITLTISFQRNLTYLLAPYATGFFQRPWKFDVINRLVVTHDMQIRLLNILKPPNLNCLINAQISIWFIEIWYNGTMPLWSNLLILLKIKIFCMTQGSSLLIFSREMCTVNLLSSQLVSEGWDGTAAIRSCKPQLESSGA